MFTHTCTACERTQLIFMSQVTGVSGSGDDAAATFNCWCGATQSTGLPLFGRTAQTRVAA